MNTLKLLIADGNEEFRLALAEALQGAYHVRICRDGKEALALLHTFVPDIFVLDLMLPGLDGISLLQAAADDGICPKVLATTRFLSDYVLENADKLGVSYLMVKPCDVRATAARIEDLSRRLTPTAAPAADPKSYVSNLLLSLSVPTKLNGYAYLQEAVVLMVKDPRQSITKELYPAVGSLCRCNASNVERSIRNAIAAAWNHMDARIWQLYFSPSSDGVIPRPTNAAFISRLADSLRLSRDDGII